MVLQAKMMFSEICKILNCPTNVVVGEHVPESAIRAEDLENEFLNEESEVYNDLMECYEHIEFLIEWYEHVTDYDY